MFDGIRRRWAEARADVVSEQVDDILRRYEAMHSPDKRLVASAFEAMLSELVDKLGPLTRLPNKEMQGISKQIMEASQSAFKTPGSTIYAETSRISSYGGALLALYLELQTLPGDQAVRVIASIENWLRRAEEQLARERAQ
jgi:hypothetical protein